MESIKNLLYTKAEQIDESGVRNDVHILQVEVDRLFSGVNVQSMADDGAVLLTTQSSAIASDIRLRQRQLLADFNSGLRNKITRLRVRIQ